MSRLLKGLCFPAYIRGEITFNLVIKPETYKRRLEMDGKYVDEPQKLFFQIPDTMLKCVGLIETNEEEYDACIDMLFKFMIFGRATKSIDGQFFDGLEIAVHYLVVFKIKNLH